MKKGRVDVKSSKKGAGKVIQAADLFCAAASTSEVTLRALAKLGIALSRLQLITGRWLARRTRRINRRRGIFALRWTR